MSKALIVFGTRYGAAASTSEEIAKVFSQQGLDVQVVNAKEEKVIGIAGYDLIVVGSGILINKWTSEPEKFLKKFRKELSTKKLALFVCCGSASSNEPDVVAKAKRKYLDEKVSKYDLQPIALGLFGGVFNYNKEPWYAKKAMEMDRPRVEAAYKQTQPGIYDTRDLNATRSWAGELTQTVSMEKRLMY
jgi:menaquinone-dependent protoporphyrinogen oxidase